MSTLENIIKDLESLFIHILANSKNVKHQAGLIKNKQILINCLKKIESNLDNLEKQYEE